MSYIAIYANPSESTFPVTSWRKNWRTKFENTIHFPFRFFAFFLQKSFQKQFFVWFFQNFALGSSSKCSLSSPFSLTSEICLAAAVLSWCRRCLAPLRIRWKKKIKQKMFEKNQFSVRFFIVFRLILSTICLKFEKMFHRHSNNYAPGLWWHPWRMNWWRISSTASGAFTRIWAPGNGWKKKNNHKENFKIEIVFVPGVNRKF